MPVEDGLRNRASGRVPVHSRKRNPGRPDLRWATGKPCQPRRQARRLRKQHSRVLIASPRPYPLLGLRGQMALTEGAQADAIAAEYSSQCFRVHPQCLRDTASSQVGEGCHNFSEFSGRPYTPFSWGRGLREVSVRRQTSLRYRRRCVLQ